MKLFEQEEKGLLRTKSRKGKKKKLRRMKNKRERKAANENPEIYPNYGKYKGYEL